MALRYQCFVINLDRQPGRLADFYEWNSGCGLSIERFAAVDGHKLDERARRAIAKSDRVTRGMIGSCSSHKQLWEYARNASRPTVIFEDDVVLRADIRTVLPPLIAGIGRPWDIVLLGFNTNSLLVVRPGEPVLTRRLPKYPTGHELKEFKSSRDIVALARLSYTFGIGGYVLTPTGAKKLLDLCFPIDDELVVTLPYFTIPVKGLDYMLNLFYRDIQAYICVPPLALSPNDQKTSGTRG